MSSQEKTITISLSSYVLILGFYLISLLQMNRDGGLNSGKLFALWVTIVITILLVNVIVNILTAIVTAVVHAIKTGSEKTENYTADERDKLIGLKGTRLSHYTFGMGVALSMLTFVLGRSPLVMFNLIIFFSIVSELVGDFSKLYYYRKGV